MKTGIDVVRGTDPIIKLICMYELPFLVKDKCVGWHSWIDMKFRDKCFFPLEDRRKALA